MKTEIHATRCNTPSKPVTPAAYAKSKNLNRSTISRQIRDGVIPMQDGLIDPAKADEARAAKLDPIRGRRKIEPPVTLQEARRRKEVALAEIRELEAKAKRGKLLDAAQVERAWSDIVSAARNRLLLVGAKVASKVVGKSDPREAQAIIDGAIREVLSELASKADAKSKTKERKSNAARKTDRGPKASERRNSTRG